MDSIINFNFLLSLNFVVLGCLFVYLVTKIKKHRSAVYLITSLFPLISFQIGSFLFANWPTSEGGARLIVLAAALVPVTIVPVSHMVGRTPSEGKQSLWVVYYGLQMLLLAFVVREIFSGGIIEWVTAILEQPIVIIANHWRYYFLNIIGSSILALLCFDNTLRRASKAQQDELKFVLIAFLSFAVYFSYFSINILRGSYISQAMLQLGTTIILVGSVLLIYGFGKYPLWEVNIRVSRHLVFGSLSVTAALVYLIISGTILDLLRLLQPQDLTVLLPVAAFALVVPFLFIYMSPKLHSRAKGFVTRHFFRHKYDYRGLWMKFSDKSSGSLDIRDLLPRVAEFVADAMFVRQVAFWLRSPTAETYHLAYCHDGPTASRYDSAPLLLDRSRIGNKDFTFFRVPAKGDSATTEDFPVMGSQALNDLGIQRLVLVEKGNEVLAMIGIGAQRDERSFAEDEQFLSSVSNQLGHLILTHKLSEELLLAREWDSFNRFASFILHDLKNLATLQGMTLENAKHFSHNPEFISDAFASFGQTTEKMITLIASLSVQRGQFSLKQQPVNILEIIAHTFDNLKIEQRNGVRVRTAFPPQEQLPAISGDPELLQKAFTNLLLNAIQSLPKGQGAVEVTVAHEPRGKITASIRDTGCGIAPERLESLFRPFQTTKEQGLGIGLCHTRSIIEVHGGRIRIESQLNAGTKVEVELPTL
jgi:putative PEP-CTERM system histidine kinase